MNRIEKVIAYLEEMPKQGVSYDEKGRHGWRNPIRADTGSLLQALVMAKKPYNVLEIGTAYGLSALYIASKLPKGAGMITIEWDKATAKEAQKNFDEAGVDIEVRNGDAMSLIHNLNHPAFDFVFMDANKDGYLEQIVALAAKGLLQKGTLIVADNVIDREKECANFLEYMKDSNHVILQTECGLLVAVWGH